MALIMLGTQSAYSWAVSLWT